jgi:tetratricopeptide (TPR) repeat protein
MAMLRASLEHATAGRGRLVLLAGEPGIGKTRICEEVAAYARDHGARVLWGRCYEGEGAPAFWPWVQVLRAGVKQLDPDRWRALGDAAALAHLVPEIGAHFGDRPPPQPNEVPEARFQLFDAAARLLAQLAQNVPLLIILDDLHGADRSSLLLLEFITRALRELPIQIVGTHRDIDTHREPLLMETLVDLVREPGTERLVLRGLNQSEVGELVESGLGRKPPAALVTQLHERTEGNPLFVGEFLRVLAAEGHELASATSWNVAIPNSVKAVIERRLAPLSMRCREVLRVAAAMGREFELMALGLVLSAIGAAATEGQSPEVATVHAIEEAEAAGIAGKVPGPSRRYRFAHALIRETIYETLRSSERAQLHQYVGETIERLGEVDEHLSELAYHFVQAGDGSRDKATLYAQRAGSRALSLFASEEAVRLFQLALAVLAQAGTQGEARRCTLLVDLGVAQYAAGDIEASKGTLTQAAEVAERLGQREELTRAALHYGTKFLFGEGSEPDPQQLRLLERALTAWGDTNSCAHARLLARLAVALRFSEQHERRVTVSRRAVEMARELGDVGVIAYALHAWHAAHWRPDNLDERLAVAAELVGLAEELRDGELAFEGHFWCFDDLLEAGDLAAAEAELTICKGLAEKLQLPYYRWRYGNAQVLWLTLEGRFADAERLAQANVAVGQGVNAGASTAFAIHMFVLACAQGRRETLEAAAKSFSVLVRQFPAFPTYRCAIAYLWRELDREADARAEFEQLSAHGFTDILRDQNWFLVVRQLAEVCAFLHDTDRAQALVVLLTPYDTRALAIIGGGGYLGPVSHCLGILETTLSRWDEAVQHFEYALDMNSRIGARPWRARTQYEYARLRLARAQAGDREHAQVLLEDALATARALDMSLLLERVQALITSVELTATGRGRSSEDVRAAMMLDTRRARLDANLLRHDGHYWTLVHNGAVVRLKDSKGMQYLAHLLRHPSQEFLALDLVAVGSEQLVVSSDEEWRGARFTGSAAVPILDPKAKADYKLRLTELREELREAEARNDIGHAERAHAEIEFLSQQLAAAFGLGGSDRPTGSAAERARSTATKGIKSAIAKIGAANPSAGRYLARTVRTGYFCAYQPDPDDRTSWQF